MQRVTRLLIQTGLVLALVLAGVLSVSMVGAEEDNPCLCTQVLAVRADSDYYSPADLDGAKIRLPGGHGDHPFYEMAQEALATYGITYTEIYLYWSEACDALTNGVIDAAVVVRHPWYCAMTAGTVRFLPWSEEAIGAVLQEFPEAVAAQLPADTYPGQTEPVPGYAALNKVSAEFQTSWACSPSGDVFTNAEVDGSKSWKTIILNSSDPTEEPLVGLNLTLESSLDFDEVSDEYLTGMGPPTYEWSFGDVPDGSRGSTNTRVGFQGEPHPFPVSFYPGFDCSRTPDSDSFLQSGGTQTQTLSLTLTPRETTEGYFIGIEGHEDDVLDAVITSYAGDGEFRLGPEGSYLFIWPAGLQLDTQWAATVTIQVTPKRPQVEFMPIVSCRRGEELASGAVRGTSVSYPAGDPADGVGTWTWSAEGGYECYEWEWSELRERSVNFHSYSREIVGIESFAIQGMLIDFDRQPDEDEVAVTRATFSLAEGASYDLSVDDVAVDVDGVLTTIPAGSFRKMMYSGGEKYRYSSPWGARPRITMILDFDQGFWRLLVHDIDAGAIDNCDGVDLTFSIGSMSAAEHVDMWVGRLSYMADGQAA